MKSATSQQNRLSFVAWLIGAALLIGGCAAPGILRDAAPRMTATSPAASARQSSPQAVMAAAVTPVSAPPAVLTFIVNPTATLQVGDAIAVQWQAIGDRAELWRNELTWWRATDIRSQLGWATAPESAYDATRQCELPSYPGMWTCYLQTPEGRVLVTRPDSTAQVRFIWDWQ